MIWRLFTYISHKHRPVPSAQWTYMHTGYHRTGNFQYPPTWSTRCQHVTQFSYSLFTPNVTKNNMFYVRIQPTEPTCQNPTSQAEEDKCKGMKSICGGDGYFQCEGASFPKHCYCVQPSTISLNHI